MNKVAWFVQDESGATAIEYALIAAAIGLMLVSVLPNLSGALRDKYSLITSKLSSADFN